jgi:hypothetical protein
MRSRGRVLPVLRTPSGSSGYEHGRWTYSEGMGVNAPTSCLFCGLALTEATRTREHVFPRWIQERYSLATLDLELANGTYARYSDLVVPACSDCNGIHASQLV